MKHTQQNIQKGRALEVDNDDAFLTVKASHKHNTTAAKQFFLDCFLSSLHFLSFISS